jgi:hypothetical protein
MIALRAHPWSCRTRTGARKRLTRQSIPDQTVQPLEPLAHVGDSGGQIDPCGWTQSKHVLLPLQCTHQAPQRIRIEIRMYLDPAPARQHHSQPATRFVLPRRFLGGQLYPHQPAGRGRINCSAPPLPVLLLQMPIQRAGMRYDPGMLSSRVARTAPFALASLLK